MKIVGVVSAKGGVGKTTVSANLSIALAAAGHPVLAIDLDPQNALRLHFGMDPGAIKGVARASLAGSAWADLMGESRSGARYLPFGAIDEEDRRRFERELDGDDDWLLRNLTTLGLPAACLVVIDTPPGASVYLRHVLRHAHFALTVMLPDVASYATIPAINGLYQTYCMQRADFLGVAYLVNQADQTRQLGRDVADVVQLRLGDKVIGKIHQDQAVSEALAFNQTVLEYDPHSQSAQDFIALAQRVARLIRA